MKQENQTLSFSEELADGESLNGSLKRLKIREYSTPLSVSKEATAALTERFSYFLLT